jgi:hypothetical protein
MTPITIFNASPLAVQISINNGAPFNIPGTYAPNWTPQTPSAGAPTWGSSTVPAPNVIAFGDNQLSVTPQGALEPYRTVLSIPAAPWGSVQIYVFFNAYSEVSWVLLNEGQFVTSNVRLSPPGLRDARARDDLGAGEVTI